MALVEERMHEIGSDEWSGGASVGDFFELLKPRVMSLVIFTALVGIVLAPGGVHPLLGAVALLAIAVGAGASGALNMWYDADIDRVMSRTAGRPIPSGRVTPEEALSFGLVLAVLSVFTLGVALNWAAAALLAFTIFFYAVVYTMWLKRSTPQNIVIGGAAGAFPPMIGWAAVTGDVSLASVVLFLIIFLWTPPHFWALALVKSDDYARAGIPMMPIVAGNASTRRQIVVYSVIFALIGLAPWALGFGGMVYGVTAGVLGAIFVGLSVDILRTGDGPHARKVSMRLFLFSIFHLFALFAVLLGERLATILAG
ncbi:heme o synthase [Methylobrevis pamukkalensis]|uniref:Protoheme IX farnesyltransferase n=1 Tax=Methylobrevis pamukkalensis TaxID=1439726 RepID=A0A1E3H7Z7_9HYPH|nr:heme o synthase [Methylobrevis pamukkalensis]ODN71631.1 Protoheme IX farnesyltransferase [Methylobrevis pamukkalensis]